LAAIFKLKGDIFQAMLKLKFILSAFLVLALSHGLIPLNEIERDNNLTGKPVLQVNFEEGVFHNQNLGDVSLGDVSISVYSTTNTNFFSNHKIKDFQASLNCSKSENNFFLLDSPDNKSLCYRIGIVPIYLQTQTFLL